MSRFGRVLLRVTIIVAVLLIAAGIGGVLVVRSGWFQERVRERIVHEIEKATGGRAEIASFRFDWKRLTATVTGLVLRGKEPPTDPPLLAIQSAVVGVRVISAFERKIDLASLRLNQPRMRIVLYPDGSTNLLVTPNNWADSLLDLKVGRYEVDDGLLQYDGRRSSINVRGENLRARMGYERNGPRYRGELETRAVQVSMPGAAPIGMNLSADFALDRAGIDITALRLSSKTSRAELSGRLDNPQSPRGSLRLKASLAVRDAVDLFALPLARTGTVNFDGQMALSLEDASLAGRVDARGLGYTRDRFKVEGASLTANLRLTRTSLELRGITAHALGGTLSGAAELKDWRQFHFDGNAGGLNLREAMALVTPRSIPWNGAVAAGFSADATVGRPSVKVEAAIAIAPIGQGTPLEGQINARYDQASGKVALENSYVATPATRMEASGVLGETLAVRVESTNLDDLLPALAIADESAPKSLPVKLENGRAAFTGRISGPLDRPALSGQATIVSAAIEGHHFDRFSGQVEITREKLHLQRAAAALGSLQVEGSGDLTRDAIAAQLTFRGASLPELEKEAAIKPNITGTASGTIRLSGSPQSPDAEGTVDIENPAGFGEQLDRARATFRHSARSIAISAGQAETGGGKIQFQGDYQHAADDFKNGDVRLEVAGQAISLAAIKAFAALGSGIESKVDLKASGAAHIANGDVILRAVDGSATARETKWNRQPIGDVTVAAETHGSDLAVRAATRVHDVSVQGEGSWKLTGEMPGTATVHFSRADLSTIHSILMAGGPLERAELPFEGSLDGGRASVSLALRKPRDFQAELTIGTVELHAKPSQTLRLGVQAQDVAVRSSKPVVLRISSSEARIESAQFTARDTNLEATGAVVFGAKASSDLSVRGSVNLIILQLLDPNLAARGSATVQAAVRGSLNDPQLSGRMELKNASLYLGDLPNGVDNANGAVVFDRNRATIEKLTAESGGGTVNFGGFIGFGSPLLYRLQAQFRKVRVRYPEDVSVTFDAMLALNGTSEASTISGLITLARASFTPRADLARIVAQTARPIPAPASAGEYVRGMQFDVKIESGPEFEMQTSLTRNLEAEVDLRLRGTPLRPALIGTASVNEGEVQIFGNRYTVNRGDVRFVNPVRIDPVFDLDLETKVRGVTVNIAVSGTLQKLNVNYSSDPPMQPREIIALLAVGRTPADTAGLNPEVSATSSSTLAEAGGGLISQAITAQLSSRLQRFFGASRVKIDPALTGVEYLPQARLTFEQQVSTDITLTYITNLNRTQEQIVQIEYDFSRQWSAIATREANGLFGIDFQFRKRFK